MVSLAGFAVTQTASADSQFLAITPTYIPSYFALGVGAYPDYVGSDDYALGVAPIGRYGLGGNRYISLAVTYVTINLLDNENWQFGPAGSYRFGRGDVRDSVVRKLPELDPSLDLGVFAGYEAVGEDPRDRWRVGADYT